VAPVAQRHVALADAHAHAVRAPLQGIALGLAVARHAQHFEGHHHARAARVAVVGGKVAHDAAADLASLGLHHDHLGHREHAVGGDADLAVEVEDPLGRLGVGCNSQDGENRESRQARGASL
jgi:hypothetical protein